MGILKKKTTKKDAVEAVEEKKAPVSDKKKATKKAAPKKATPAGTQELLAAQVLVRPVVSEKALQFESKGTYTFEVAVDANKVAVKKAVAALYGVMPKKVRIMNVEGKRTFFRRSFGRRKSIKKAIVTLPKGQTINIHEGV